MWFLRWSVFKQRKTSCSYGRLELAKECFHQLDQVQRTKRIDTKTVELLTKVWWSETVQESRWDPKVKWQECLQIRGSINQCKVKALTRAHPSFKLQLLHLARISSSSRIGLLKMRLIFWSQWMSPRVLITLETSSSSRSSHTWEEGMAPHQLRPLRVWLVRIHQQDEGISTTHLLWQILNGVWWARKRTRGPRPQCLKTIITFKLDSCKPHNQIISKGKTSKSSMLWGDSDREWQTTRVSRKWAWPAEMLKRMLSKYTIIKMPNSMIKSIFMSRKREIWWKMKPRTQI